MAAPKAVADYLSESAKRAGVARLGEDDDLFRAGVLDSFSVLDLISVLEEACGMRVPDADVSTANFRSLNAIERYIESRKV